MHKLNMVQNEQKELLDVNEAAFKLGVAPKTIRKWQHQGKLPYVKLFGAVRFEAETLKILIKSSRIQRGMI